MFYACAATICSYNLQSTIYNPLCSMHTCTIHVYTIYPSVQCSSDYLTTWHWYYNYAYNYAFNYYNYRIHETT